ncbi:MAG: gamma-glutamylcyclotransferase [Candidatus Korobacteraceae bacterium]
MPSRRQSVWVFGYGSLLWNTGDVKPVERRIGVLEGWHREWNWLSKRRKGAPTCSLEKGGRVKGIFLKLNSTSADADLEKFRQRERRITEQVAKELPDKGSKTHFWTMGSNLPSEFQQLDQVHLAETLARRAESLAVPGPDGVLARDYILKVHEFDPEDTFTAAIARHLSLGQDAASKDTVSSAESASSPSTEEVFSKVTAFLRERGTRRSDRIYQWATSRLDQLKDFHIEQDWKRLEELGVAREVLAAAGMLINIAPIFDFMFKTFFGDKRQRQARSRALLTPIPALKELDQLWASFGVDSESFASATKQLSPRSIISGLEHYSELMVFGENIFEILDANSALEVARYTLAGLAKRVTGSFHDREVSALTGASLQKADYDETAHRVWRIRNYSRLDASGAAYIPTALHALNVVLNSPR